ncbi:cation:proton antiporter [Candidatus Bipolaricaulota bacterium]|nr:cation:proton antiporter [Candidatus Bipolaricaulota bacterium]
MNALLILGSTVVAGYFLGELAAKLGLPRVSGYILAGLALNPNLTTFVPPAFVASTGTVTNLSLAVLTFAVGGTLAFASLKELGKGILFLALGESELSALLVTGGLMVTLPFFVHIEGTYLTTILPLALLLGALASPTDPSATLAVIHQYKAKGIVSFSIMASAAVDDALGILNFSFATMIATILVAHTAGGFETLIEPFIAIFGAIGLGVACGLLFHFIPRLLHAEADGLLLVLLIGLLALAYGLSTTFKLDELLSTMAMGVMVVNFGNRRDRVFHLLEEYVEPIVFVLFFTISGMLLDFQVLFRFFPVVLIFVLFRSLGKIGGAYLGATVGRTSREVRRYAGWGLIPQGGIVIGLALVLQRNTAFGDLSSILVNVVIGATVIHELIGPLTAKLAILKSGEIGGGINPS